MSKFNYAFLVKITNTMIVSDVFSKSLKTDKAVPNTYIKMTKKCNIKL